MAPARLSLTVGALLLVAAHAEPEGRAELPVEFDFERAQEVLGWEAVHHVAGLRCSPDGLIIEIAGDDPYLRSPARDYPDGQPLWLSLRLKTDVPGTGQVLYYTAHKPASESDSTRFVVAGGSWQDVRVPLPPLGRGYYLRLDPPGGQGNVVVVARFRVAARSVIPAPEWPIPRPIEVGDDALVVRCGDIELRHRPDQWGGFVVRVAGQAMAAGLAPTLVGYTVGQDVRWVRLGEPGQARVRSERNELVAETNVRDPDGADWTLRHRFTCGSAVSGRTASDSLINVCAELSVSQDRMAVFVPMLITLPGLGSFGQTKSQALFPGLEYLDRDEPSSSEADIRGPDAQRQVPDTLKITFPLMVVQAEGCFVGVEWKMRPEFAALFDSPDRCFKSGAHAVGIVFPGADDSQRPANGVLPCEGRLVPAGQTLTLHATLLGGRGESVVPAIRQYVALRGLPAVPMAGIDWPSYLATASAGWLDSAIRVGDEYRHAFPGSFRAQPAADAALFMDWLGVQSQDPNLKARLRDAARAALARVRPEDLNVAAVGHIRTPAPALVFGQAAAGAARARQQARDTVKRFEPDGSVLYRPPPNGPDYGQTHFARDANGLTAQHVLELLRAAAFCGDRDRIDDAVRLLRALDKFANTVPRGAQTWELPLHTPDILAAAHLVRAYTWGYELTGDTQLLSRAEYWAWTGVPFVYLEPPTGQRVGLYATIPVFGATQWVAPNWMGLPVQWCGLVYADALYRLATHDPDGPWHTLADGITASGVQQTWPGEGAGERCGLLPDSFALRAQVRQDPAINPATLLPEAARLFRRPLLCDFRAFRDHGLWVHAPGQIDRACENPQQIGFTVRGWPDRTYQVLVAGLRAAPRVRVNGRAADLRAPHEYHASDGWLVLTLEGSASVEIAP